MDMGIVNAGELPVYDDIDPVLREAVEDVILNRSADGPATERLVDWPQVQGRKGAAGRRPWPGASCRWPSG